MDYNIVILPLSEKYRKRFDAEKAWEAFDEVEG